MASSGKYESLTLHEFVIEFWETIEKRTFRDNWHIGAICEFLTALTNREFRKGIINVPPRFGKSTMVNVMWPAWVWGENVGVNGASEQFFFSSYGDDLVKRDSLRMREVIQHPKYEDRYGHVFRLTEDQNEKKFYTNTERGYRACTTVGGSGTGKGGDILVWDDPIKIEEAYSEATRTRVATWYDTVFSQRKNDPQTTCILGIMQRVHNGDLTGHVLEKAEDDGWVVLRLPNEFEYDFRTVVYFDGEKVKNRKKPLEILSPDDQQFLDELPEKEENETLEEARRRLEPPFALIKDPRQNEGDLLWPDRFDSEQTEDAKRTLGADYPGQYQQRPRSRTGGAVKESWFRFWVPVGTDLPPHTIRLDDGTSYMCPQVELPEWWSEQIQSWDMSFKDAAGSSRVSGQVWARNASDMFLLDCDTRRMDLPAAIRAVREMTKKWPNAFGKLIEDKANGPAVMQMLRGKVAGMVAVPPEGGKIARLNAVSYLIEGGNVYLPHPMVSPWVYDFITEFLDFPGPKNDQVDAATQALSRLARHIDIEDDEIVSVSQQTY